MGANPFGAGPASPYGAPPSPSLAYGAPQPPSQQPPRFSAGSLISDGDLPEWLRESADGHGAPAPQPAAWGAPAQPTPPAPGQGWAPEPQRPDIAAQHTIRQPIVGAPNPAAQNPFGQAPMNYPQQPYPPQVASPGYPAGYQAPYPQPQAYPPQQPGFAQQQQTPYSQQPGFAQPQAGYPQQPYPQQPYPQQQTPPGSINAFPGIEQAGVAYHGPQVGGMAGQALVNHQSLPNWLSGAPGQPGLGQGASQAPSSGMQARSLVDDQLLPKWLRDQPDDAGRANVSEWIGASAAQEPMPPFLNEAYAQAQVTRARQPNDGAFYQQPSPPRSGPVGGYGEDPAMPDWLRAQAQSGAGVASQANAHQQPGGFAASDLIDPAALPDWVTRRAPAAQPYSAANGWNAANPAGSMMVAPEPTYDQQGVDQGYDQQGFDQQGYDQQGYDQQGYDQEPAPWGASGAQDDQDYGQQSRSEQRYGRGQPLAADELPSWLRGGVGAPAARGRTPAAERNPWASAAEPMDSAEAWDEAEPWDEGDGQAAPGWGASGWDDGYSDGRDGGRDGGRRSDWDASEPTADWGESASRRSRGGTARRQRARPDERDDYGDDRYADARYGARQYADDDEPADDYGDYDEEPDDRAQGRGWLGFLRRDKR